MKRADPIAELTPAALATVVSCLYPLRGAVTCEPLSSGLNDLFKVEADGRPHALKVYRRGWRSREEVLGEIAALRHLESHGVGVARPVPRTDGEEVWALATPAGERQAVLFEWAEGQEICAAGAAGWRAMGGALARVHNAVDDFPGAPQRYGLEELLFEPLRALEPYLSERAGDRPNLRALAQRLRERIAALPPADLDWGYCHGDFRPANLHVNEATGELTLFDFELGGTGFRAYDIAYAQTNLHRLALELLWGAPEVGGHERLWEAFLAGYNERRALSASAREAIPLFVALRPLQIMTTLLKTARQPADQESWPPRGKEGLPGGDLFDRSLRFLRAWDETYL